MLEQIGIYGMEKIETALLAGLVTGDPVLLVGSHGSGKTLLCSRLAQALGLNFWAYDAGKALFEDVLGFPNPASLSSGEIAYIPTPISIWGKEFVLIDELSRANPAMQNKWLEVIRSRKIMGKPLPDLKFIFAAMNPTTYLGTHPLDAALAGRFAIIVQVPEVSEMPPEAVSRIVSQISEDDAPMLQAQRRAPQDLDLPGFLATCRTRLSAFPAELRERLSGYVQAVSQFLASREIPLDGRRLGMIWRSLQAYLAVLMVKNRQTDLVCEDHAEEIFELLPFSLPFTALAENLSEAVLKAAHLHARIALSGGQPRGVVTLPGDSLQAADVFIANAPRMLPEERKAGLTRFISRAKSDTGIEQKAPAIVAMLKLVSAVCEGSLRLDPDDQYRVLSFYLRSAVLEHSSASPLVLFHAVAQQEADLDWQDPKAILSFRLAAPSVLAKINKNRGWHQLAAEHGKLAREIHQHLK